MEGDSICWSMCQDCKGLGKKYRRLRKKLRVLYQSALAAYEEGEQDGPIPIRPKGAIYPCPTCKGAGILPTISHPVPDTENYPHVAIIGGGIGGAALAIACLHRGIPYTLYERDASFDARSQGYGLTLQQASKAMAAFGLQALSAGVISTRHVVHTPDGSIIGEWGMRKRIHKDENKTPKRTNVHIARQALRQALLGQLGRDEAVQWGHQLVGLQRRADETIDLSFEVDGQVSTATADLVIGADGIRSTVRSLILGEASAPLQYLGCIVILGICPMEHIKGLDSPLLDGATVFQTANGNERIYMMPFSVDTVMWQLSFPMPEEEAKALSAEGAKALKAEACRRLPWHTPIPQILKATPEDKLSGYPVYDRALLDTHTLDQAGAVSILGDAAHPMSPFKGQGANQALLDALLLARGITQGCTPSSKWRTLGIRKTILSDFEHAMMARTAVKVKDSAEAAKFLHSKSILQVSNEPRGRDLNKA